MRKLNPASWIKLCLSQECKVDLTLKKKSVLFTIFTQNCMIIPIDGEKALNILYICMRKTLKIKLSTIKQKAYMKNVQLISYLMVKYWLLFS